MFEWQRFSSGWVNVFCVNEFECYSPDLNCAYSAFFWRVNDCVRGLSRRTCQKMRKLVRVAATLEFLTTQLNGTCEDGRVHGKTEGSDTGSAHLEIKVDVVHIVISALLDTVANAAANTDNDESEVVDPALLEEVANISMKLNDRRSQFNNVR